MNFTLYTEPAAPSKPIGTSRASAPTFFNEMRNVSSDADVAPMPNWKSLSTVPHWMTSAQKMPVATAISRVQGFTKVSPSIAPL